MKTGVLAAALAVVCAVLTTASAAAADDPAELRSRGFAGFGHRSVTDEDASTLGLSGARGVVVTLVVPGSPAERAGLMEGDAVLAMGGDPIVDASTIPTVIRRYYAGDEVVLTVVRQGQTLAVPVVLAASRERGDGVDVQYTSFVNGDGNRLRAVITSPTDAGDDRLPALLLVSALSSPRLVDAPGYGMLRTLAHETSKAGLRVMRFEQRGSGDSEGEDFREADLATEVGDNLAALDYLAGREDVDPSRVFVMGHSTGGFVAAQVASRRELAGLIVSCTIGRTFYERMLETLRLQCELAGDRAAEADSTIVDYLSLCVAVASGEPLSSITDRAPRLARFVNSSGRIMDDRTAAYWQQQLTLNLPDVYGAVAEPVLIIYAASDFLTQLACHERIRDVLEEAGNEDVTLAVIEDLDHAYSHAANKAASFEHYPTRAFEPNPAPVELIKTWLSERAP